MSARSPSTSHLWSDTMTSRTPKSNVHDIRTSITRGCIARMPSSLYDAIGSGLPHKTTLNRNYVVVAIRSLPIAFSLTLRDRSVNPEREQQPINAGTVGSSNAHLHYCCFAMKPNQCAEAGLHSRLRNRVPQTYHAIDVASVAGRF